MKLPSFTHGGEGYNPVLMAQGWQVAFLNHAESQTFDAIRRLDRHMLTDEAFSLVEGDAWLFVAEEAAGSLDVAVEKMESSVLYNVPALMWHNIVLEAGAKVLIIERDGTHLSDFEFRQLVESERSHIHSLLVKAGMKPASPKEKP